MSLATYSEEAAVAPAAALRIARAISLFVSDTPSFSRIFARAFRTVRVPSTSATALSTAASRSPDDEPAPDESSPAFAAAFTRRASWNSAGLGQHAPRVSPTRARAGRAPPPLKAA